MGALRRANITDRALRYRANQPIPEHLKVCAFCGGTGKLDVCHLNGNESDGQPDNLTWGCRSCNVVAGNVLSNAGIGRKTHQYNPTRSGGASSVGEWLQAVGAITPHINRGDRGLASSMSVSEAVAMIRATPHHRRSEFAAKLRKKNPGWFSPGGPGYRAPGQRPKKTKSSWGSRDYVRDVQAERKAASRQADIDARLARADAKRQAKLLGARKVGTPKKSRLLDSEMAKGIFGLNPASPNYDASLLDHARTARSTEELQRLYSYGKKKRDSELMDAAARRARDLGRRINPAAAAEEAYEDFHGHPSTETIQVKKRVHYHKHLPAAGELRALRVMGIDHKPHRISRFKGAFLCFNEKRNQLFVEGGDQEINLEDYGIRSPHEIETLGRVVGVDYFTTKTHLGEEGGTAIYDHGFRMTNQNGEHIVVKISRYPDLIYRVLDQQLEFSGGSYTIRREGIDR